VYPVVLKKQGCRLNELQNAPILLDIGYPIGRIQRSRSYRASICKEYSGELEDMIALKRGTRTQFSCVGREQLRERDDKFVRYAPKADARVCRGDFNPKVG